MSNTKAIIIAGAIIGACLLASGLTGSEADLRQSPSKPVSAQDTDAPTSAERTAMRKAYVDGCTSSPDVTKAYCDCTIDYMVDIYGWEAVSNQAQVSDLTGNLTPEATEAVYACLGEL